jgi:hypothetical protein
VHYAHLKRGLHSTSQQGLVSRALGDNRRLRGLLGGVKHKTPRPDLRPQRKEEHMQQISGLKQDNLRLADELDEACDITKSALSDSAREGIDPFLRLVGKRVNHIHRT